MSLINEALKRAGQKPAAPPSASETAAGLRPAEEDRPHGFPVLTLFIVLIPLIAIGLWFLVKGLQMKEAETPTPAPVAHARTVPEPPTASAAAAVSVQPPATSPGPPPPTYKLQGIYWRPSRPSAVVNGKTVYVGDRVDASVRIRAIDKESVTLSINGESKVLLLP